jgi:16S rRNA processing protein RimM
VNKQACFELGYIAKPFGLKGQVTAVFDVDNPLTYKNLESVFVETDNTLIPFFCRGVKNGPPRSDNFTFRRYFEC